MADGFHLFTPAQAAAYTGYNGHYCKLYANITKGEAEAKDAYAGFCNEVECPVNCEMSSWGDWSQCSKTCGTGGVNK